jgi:hypothetical protein
MTYFYKSGTQILKQEGGEPPADEFVALAPDGILRHYKDNRVVEQDKIVASNIEHAAANLAHNMLIPTFRAKKQKQKSKVKRCKCK